MVERLIMIIMIADDVAAAPEVEARVPHYLACNRDRFPYCTVLYCTVLYCTVQVPLLVRAPRPP